jgi:hypothetical protein
MFFSGLDIEHFYIALRSFFDQLAGVCRAVAIKRDQVPRSFRTLLDLCEAKSPKAVEILGREIVEFIVSCDWFRSTRATRDGIVHYGALTLTRPNFDTIAFQVSAGERSSSVIAELTLKNSLADFELFMAWILGNIILMLDHLAGLLLSRFPDLSSVVVRSARPSYTVLCAYLERLSDVMPRAADSIVPGGA